MESYVHRAKAKADKLMRDNPERQLEMPEWRKQ